LKAADGAWIVENRADRVISLLAASGMFTIHDDDMKRPSLRRSSAFSGLSRSTLPLAWRSEGCLEGVSKAEPVDNVLNLSQEFTTNSE
jgi:hypothetical protein